MVFVVYRAIFFFQEIKRKQPKFLAKSSESVTKTKQNKISDKLWVIRCYHFVSFSAAQIQLMHVYVHIYPSVFFVYRSRLCAIRAYARVICSGSLISQFFFCLYHYSFSLHISFTFESFPWRIIFLACNAHKTPLFSLLRYLYSNTL